MNKCRDELDEIWEDSEDNLNGWPDPICEECSEYLESYDPDRRPVLCEACWEEHEQKLQRKEEEDRWDKIKEAGLDSCEGCSRRLNEDRINDGIRWCRACEKFATEEAKRLDHESEGEVDDASDGQPQS